MQRQMYTQHKQTPFVKADPRIKMWWSETIFLGFFSILACIMDIWIAFTGSSFNAITSIMMIMVLSQYIVMLSSSKQLEQKRQAAACGDQRLLANIQPTPNTQAIPLPTTIGMHPKWGVIMACPAIIIVLLLLFCTPLFLPAVAFTSARAHILATLLFSLVIILIPTIIIQYVQACKRITITPHGIMVTGIFQKIQNISWHEAQLFAITEALKNNTNAPKNNTNAPVMFELASPHEVIQWRWLRRNEFFYPAKPSVPPDVYDQQMNGILEIIKGKTGLPLYDLRKML